MNMREGYKCRFVSSGSLQFQKHFDMLFVKSSLRISEKTEVCWKFVTSFIDRRVVTIAQIVTDTSVSLEPTLDFMNL